MVDRCFSFIRDNGTPEMIDTHAHLTWPTFDGRVAEVVDRARDAGVLAIVDLGTDVASSRRAREHAHRFDRVWFGAAIHPNDAGNANPGDEQEIAALCADEKCVAVGETGLDFYRDHADPDVQERWFREMLALATRIEKPVVIHDRKASRRLIEVLDDARYDGLTGPGGVFHCFAGDADTARAVLERGFHISFTGNITFRNSDRAEVAKLVPLDRLMLETDSPFLAPVPKRGKTNEPANIPYIAAVVASAHGIDLDTAIRETTRTAVRFFDLPPSIVEELA